MIASDIRRALDDCGDGIEVKADGRPIIAAQIEGTTTRVLNLVSQPADVRVPEDGAVETSGGTTLPSAEQPEQPALPGTDEVAAVPVADAVPAAFPGSVPDGPTTPAASGEPLI